VPSTTRANNLTNSAFFSTIPEKPNQFTMSKIESQSLFSPEPFQSITINNTARSDKNLKTLSSLKHDDPYESVLG
jgi:hypothetical protein